MLLAEPFTASPREWCASGSQNVTRPHAVPIRGVLRSLVRPGAEASKICLWAGVGNQPGLGPNGLLQFAPAALPVKRAARFGCASHHALQAEQALARDRALKYFFLLPRLIRELFLEKYHFF